MKGKCSDAVAPYLVEQALRDLAECNGRHARALVMRAAATDLNKRLREPISVSEVPLSRPAESSADGAEADRESRLVETLYRSQFKLLETLVNNGCLDEESLKQLNQSEEFAKKKLKEIALILRLYRQIKQEGAWFPTNRLFHLAMEVLENTLGVSSDEAAEATVSKHLLDAELFLDTVRIAERIKEIYVNLGWGSDDARAFGAAFRRGFDATLFLDSQPFRNAAKLKEWADFRLKRAERMLKASKETSQKFRRPFKNASGVPALDVVPVCLIDVAQLVKHNSQKNLDALEMDALERSVLLMIKQLGGVADRASLALEKTYFVDSAGHERQFLNELGKLYAGKAKEALKGAGLSNEEEVRKFAESVGDLAGKFRRGWLFKMWAAITTCFVMSGLIVVAFFWSFLEVYRVLFWEGFFGTVGALLFWVITPFTGFAAILGIMTDEFFDGYFLLRLGIAVAWLIGVAGYWRLFLVT